MWWFRKKAEPVNEDLSIEEAINCSRRGDYVEAIRRVDVMLQVAPEIALSWKFKAECLFKLDRFSEAEACFRQAQKLGGPGTEDAMFWVGFCQYNSGQREAAKATVQAYIDNLPPEAAEPRRNAERALIVMGGPT